MGVEEERGMVEFDLSAQGIVGSALLTFENAPFRTCCVGVTGGSYTLGVFSYFGDNTITVTDYQAPRDTHRIILDGRPHRRHALLI